MGSLPSILSLLALALMGSAWWVATHPHLIARRQDAFGRGMATAALTLLLLALSSGCALASVIMMIVRWSSTGWAARSLAVLPAAVLLSLLAASLIRLRIRRARLASRFADNV